MNGSKKYNLKHMNYIYNNFYFRLFTSSKVYIPNLHFSSDDGTFGGMVYLHIKKCHTKFPEYKSIRMGLSYLLDNNKYIHTYIPFKWTTDSVYYLEHENVMYKQILVFQPPQRPQAASIG